MSIVEPYEVELQLFGEVHFVPRTAWSPFFLKGVFFYVFGTFWTLEFLSFGNKYITAQVGPATPPKVRKAPDLRP